MTQSVFAAVENHEIQRLKSLIPVDLQSKIVVARSNRTRPALITSEKLGNQQFAIAIDFIQWEQFSPQQRDLLFWHEVARIQNRAIPSFPWELAVLTAALGLALMEVTTQNLLLLSVTLVVAGLSGNQLYQRNRGEHALREATAADQSAIAFALQFGYSWSEATASLRSAIQQLGRQATRRILKNRYKVRLQVLEILVANQPSTLRISSINIEEHSGQKPLCKPESIGYLQF